MAICEWLDQCTAPKLFDGTTHSSGTSAFARSRSYGGQGEAWVIPLDAQQRAVTDGKVLGVDVLWFAGDSSPELKLWMVA